MTAVDAPGLAGLLRAATRDAHERAESESFVTDLVAGRLPRAAYAALATQHLAIYTALERRQADLAGDPVADAVRHPALTRVPRLDHDLDRLLGEGRRAQADPLDATREYVARIDAATAPAFVAHHYVRYLGDLSGGQVVRRALVHTFGPDTPVAFYDFDGVGPIKPFRDRYRDALDALPLDGDGRAELVAEAVTAFELNRAVFAQLAAAHG